MDGLFNPIYYTAEHRAFASSIKRFVEKEISPYVNEWDEAETFPRELYQKAASVGLLGLGFDAEHGGIPDADAFYVMLAAIEMATQTMQFCADAAVQTLGGMGFMRGTKSERIYREVKVNMIGGGAEEIMKDLASRQLGY